MSVYEDILAWSSDSLTPWQQDALRRLFESGDFELSEKEITELIDLCIEFCDPAKTDPIDTTPLASQHLPGGTQDHDIALLRIKATKNVNLLPDGSEHPFEESGLSISYGPNGSGKTGFVRILKSAARSRGHGTIYPNVFVYASTDGVEISATIVIKEGDTTDEVPWIQGRESDERLGSIRVFDSDVASLLIEKKDFSIALAPMGLDVFERLARVYDRVRQGAYIKLDDIDKTFLSNFHKDTGAEKAIQAALTENESLTVSAFTGHKTNIEELGKLTAEEEKALEDLERQFSGFLYSDKEAAKRILVTRKQRIEALRDELQYTIDLLGPTGLKNLIILNEEIISATTQAEAAGKRVGAHSSLDGIESKEWADFWRSSKLYSEKFAYPGKEFPQTTGKVCVLCQQSLDANAVSRLDAFKDYVQHATVQNLENAREHLRKRIVVLNHRTPYESQRITLHELADELPEFVEEATKQMTLADTFREEVLLKSTDLTALDALQSPLSLQLQPLTDYISQLDLQIEALNQFNTPENAAAREQLRELQDRANINKFDDSLKRALARAEIRVRMIKHTNRLKVTVKGTDLTKQYVNDAFEEKLLNALAQVGLKHIDITLTQPRSESGIPHFRVDLKDKKLTSVGSALILSEGEVRALAMATFVAEAQALGGSAPLVFDDPVSSLDDVYRKKIADFIVRLAADRQVIVFTHDLSFVVDLGRAAKLHTTAPRNLHFSSARAELGRVRDGLPWRITNLEKALRELGQDLDEQLVPIEQDSGHESSAYRQRAVGWITEFRKILETFIERELFAGVIDRTHAVIRGTKIVEIPTQMLSQEDLRHLQALYDAASDEGIHLQDLRDIQEVPTAEELRGWLEGFTQIRNILRGDTSSESEDQ